MKRVFTFIIAGLMILSVFAACQKGNEAGGSLENDKSGLESANQNGDIDLGNEDTNDDESSDDGNNEAASDDGNSELDVTDVEYSYVEDEDKLPDEVKQTLAAQFGKRGYFWFEQMDGKAIVVIMSGEKSTGGYDIEVVSAEITDGTVNLVVKETAPGKDDVVTQALTYPYIVVYLEATPEYVLVTNESGEKFENQVLSELKFGEGTFNGIIDKNSVEIKINEGYEYEGSGKDWAFRLDDYSRKYFDSDSSIYKDLKDNTNVEFSFYINEHGQYVLYNISAK